MGDFIIYILACLGVITLIQVYITLTKEDRKKKREEEERRRRNEE